MQDVRTGELRADFKLFLERLGSNGHCQEIGGSGKPIHRPQDREGLQGHRKDREEAKHPLSVRQNCLIEEESAGENPPGSEEDGQGQGRLEDHNVEVMPGGPGNETLQKTAPASPIGGHQGQTFGARTSNPENLARWHDIADLVDG